MANEELNQREYLANGYLKGKAFGRFEEVNIGATRLDALVKSGVSATLPKNYAFQPSEYKAPNKPESLKPDTVILERIDGDLITRAVVEHKRTSEFNGKSGPKKILSAQEQALMSASCLGAPIAVATNGVKYFYIDVPASILRRKSCQSF